MNYSLNMALGGHCEFCQKKECSAHGRLWAFLEVIKEGIVRIMNTS